MSTIINPPMSLEDHPTRSALVFHPAPAAVLAGLVAAGIRWAPEAVMALAAVVALIVAHEAAHFVAARARGMRPTELFAGFGPVVVAVQREGVTYGLKAALVGGYVKIPGMTPREALDPAIEPFSFRASSRLSRVIVVLAGPIANLVIAVLLFAAAGALVGVPVRGADGAVVDHRRSAPHEAVADGGRTTARVGQATLEGLGGVVAGADDYVAMVSSTRPGDEPTDARTAAEGPAPRFLSPVGMANVLGEAADADLYYVLGFIAMVSAALGFFNLLPLVPLDGGHAAVVLAEAVVARVRHRPAVRLDANRLNPLALAVIVVFGTLSLSALYLDVVSPISGMF